MADKVEHGEDKPYAAVNGLIFMATNSFGITTLYLLEPSGGQILGCPVYSFAFFMTGIIGIGALLVAFIRR